MKTDREEKKTIEDRLWTAIRRSSHVVEPEKPTQKKIDSESEEDVWTAAWAKSLKKENAARK